MVETEASDYTIAISLNQTSKPMAFFSNILNTCEQKHSITKKACYSGCPMQVEILFKKGTPLYSYYWSKINNIHVWF